ncbi:unnamed protein product [Cuscuta epithymum]|uniref:Cyclin-dependent kinase inhibitor domain-containing protein n=1 Tax=Cuscuta epithymum TaxID=186058 RepID=A0AAV0ERL8_9ASTE|nr:unnamed protein product [Cuscuta epithymum]
MEAYLRCERVVMAETTPMAAMVEAGAAAFRGKDGEVTIISSSKRRKVVSPSDHCEVYCLSECSVFPASSLPASECEGSSYAEEKALDLKEKGFETADTANSTGKFSGETTAITGLSQGDSGTEVDCSKKISKAEKVSSAGGKDNTPSAAEIEEFFSAAEKYQQNLFMEKYNYDVEKDVPLEGRYKWVPLKPPCSQVIIKVGEDEQLSRS